MVFLDLNDMSVCVFLQVLSPRPVPADDAVLCGRRFESSAHYSGGVKPVFQGADISEELIQRQVSPQTLSEPADTSWIKLASA